MKKKEGKIGEKEKQKGKRDGEKLGQIQSLEFCMCVSKKKKRTQGRRWVEAGETESTHIY